MKDRIRRLRWQIADMLSFAACRLRGQKWYIANTFQGVPGNRASELRQGIWTGCVLLASGKDNEMLSDVSRNLDELAQMAGENWGHFPRAKP